MNDIIERRIDFASPGGVEQFSIVEFSDHIEVTAYHTWDIENVVIPSEIGGKAVTAIDGGNCFFMHKEIKAVVMPDSIQRIGEQAFAMTGIREIALPDSVTEIGHHAFRDCRALKKIVLPRNLKRIPVGAFSFGYWGKDTVVILPEGLQTIEANAFYSALGGTIKIPDSVEEIDRQAFYMGPRAITKLPYDRRWYEEWPVGERVQAADGRSGVIDSTKGLRFGCMMVKAKYDSGVREYFLPIDLRDKQLRFVEDGQQEYAQNYFSSDSKEVAELHELWQRGLV